MLIIENDYLKVTVNPVGAEMMSIYNKEDQFDYLWQGAAWPKHAPVLFPAIGRSNEDAYLIDGQSYEMPQHGFVANQTFDIVSQSEGQIRLELVDNQQTYQYYPFHFRLTITLELNKKALKFMGKVDNLDDHELSFSFGSHPAFNVPIGGDGEFDDYQIEFETPESTINYFEIIKTPNPYRSGKLLPLEQVAQKKVQLTHQMFEKGLIIIQNPLDGIRLTSNKSQHRIHLALHDFNYFTLWTKEGANAPFLCLEPFYGLPDAVGAQRELLTKEANYRLASQEAKALGYTMSFE